MATVYDSGSQRKANWQSFVGFCHRWRPLSPPTRSKNAEREKTPTSSTSILGRLPLSFSLPHSFFFLLLLLFIFCLLPFPLPLFLSCLPFASYSDWQRREREKRQSWIRNTIAPANIDSPHFSLSLSLSLAQIDPSRWTQCIKILQDHI